MKSLKISDDEREMTLAAGTKLGPKVRLLLSDLGMQEILRAGGYPG